MVYDLFDVRGTVKLNVNYDVEGSKDDYKIIRVLITPHDENKPPEFDFEIEMDDILDQCNTDFINKQEAGKVKFVPELNIETKDETEIKLASEKFDFSAN